MANENKCWWRIRGLRPVLETLDLNVAACGHAESPISAENVRIPPRLEREISFNKKPDTRSLSSIPWTPTTNRGDMSQKT